MHKYWSQPSGRFPQKKQIPFLLDQFSSADIKKWKNIKDLLLKLLPGLSKCLQRKIDFKRWLFE